MYPTKSVPCLATVKNPGNSLCEMFPIAAQIVATADIFQPKLISHPEPSRALLDIADSWHPNLEVFAPAAALPSPWPPAGDAAA